MSFHHVLSTRRPVVLHWPEYLMEGLSLGLFMISACTFAAILEYPAQGMDRSSVGKLRSYRARADTANSGPLWRS